MDDRRALMGAILANPDEDTPRLALADWLQEYGTAADQARGEFIRAQVRCAGLKPGAARDAVETGAEQIESKHRRAWLKPLTAIDKKFEPDSYLEFKRGLLEYTWFDTGAFLLKKYRDTLPDALALVGVEELCFYSPTKRIAEFANAPALRFTAGIQYPEADDKALAAFAAAPNCAHLGRFNLGNVSLTDAGLAAFAATTNTANLRAVSISNAGGLTSTRPKLTAAGILALLNTARLPKIDTLDIELSSKRFDPAALLADPGVAKLTELRLGSLTHVADVVASRHLKNLRTLVLFEAVMEDADADALVARKSFAQLEELTLNLSTPLAPASESKIRKRFGSGLVLEYT